MTANDRFRELCAELDATWQQGIPLSVAMGMTILRGSATELTVEAPLAPNINLHGTAFAGSLYAVAALTGWGMAWLALKARGLEGSIVLAEGHVRYLKAVRGNLRCTSSFDADADGRALDRLVESGRTVLALDAVITAGDAEEDALRFEGKYAIRKR